MTEPAATRLLVTGGRDFADRDMLYATLDHLHAEYHFTLLIWVIPVVPTVLLPTVTVPRSISASTDASPQGTSRGLSSTASSSGDSTAAITRGPSPWGCDGSMK